MTRSLHPALWRLSVAVAGLLIGVSLWLGYETVQSVRFFSAVIRGLGGEGEIIWPNVLLILGLIAGFGVLLPAAYIRWAWPRAFRSGR